MSAGAWILASAASSVSSEVLRVLRADRRRGLAILDRARGRTRYDVIVALGFQDHEFIPVIF